MATKKTKSAPTDDELTQMLADLPDSAPPASKPAKSSKPSADLSKEADILAQLEKELGPRESSSRPHTPRVGAGAFAKNAPAKRGTPPPARSSEDRPSAARTSVDSSRSIHHSITPDVSESAESEKKPTPAAVAPAPALAPVPDAGGGWWGGLLSTANAAMKQAEAAVKELQQNEEAIRWAEQVRGNVGALRGLGGELRSRALPTFTNILHTLAPPISSHERLQIHVTHDFVGYPSFDPLVFEVFSRVMAQVEGGELMVLQRAQGNARRGSDAAYTGHGVSGWHDGPWWRQTSESRELGSVKGLVEGTKLARASAEGYAHEYFAARGGLEVALQKATEALSESNPVRSSDIFLAVQAIAHDAAPELFQGPPKDASAEAASAVVEDETADELVAFAVYLHDPVHSITFHTLSQSLPAKWAKWLDAPSPLTPASSSSPEQGPQAEKRAQPLRELFGGGEQEAYGGTALPDEIAEIVEAGGVDPREWVAEWLEETLNLAFGIVAQRYVARRMGVGEGGIGRGKARMDAVLEDGGGEAARAGVIV